MIISSITPFDKRRCKVSIEEDFALVLYRGEIKRYELEEGGELSGDRYEEILHTVLFKRARERVLYLLKSSDRTEAELRRKLAEGFYPVAAVNYAIDFCKKYCYVDDAAYASHYVETYKNRKSQRQLSFEMQQKGLPREMIERVIQAAHQDEESLVRTLLAKKGYGRERIDRKGKQKLQMYLMRKGFSFEVISQVMREEEWEFDA